MKAGDISHPRELFKTRVTPCVKRKKSDRSLSLLLAHFPVARKSRHDYRHECQKAADVGKWERHRTWPRWCRPAHRTDVAEQAWGADVSYKFLEPFRLRHVAHCEEDVTFPTRSWSDLRWWLGQTAMLRVNRPATFWQAISNMPLLPDHTVTGLLGTFCTHLLTSSIETLVLTDYVTDQDKIGPTKLWSAQSPFKSLVGPVPLQT